MTDSSAGAGFRRPRRGDKPLISHHRGGVEMAAHGSIDAYTSAIASGAELIEFDVWKSRDGVFYCCHDERAAGGVRLCELDWRDIQRIDPDIPRYEDLLAEADGRSICHIDLKQHGDEREIVDLAVRQLTDARSQAVFTSLDGRSVRRIRDLEPELHVALSLGRDMEGRSLLHTAWTRLTEIVPFPRLIACRANAVAVHHRLLTALLSFCGRTDRGVIVWTVNDDALLHRLLRTPGVDVVVTDRPLHATRLRDSP